LQVVKLPFRGDWDSNRHQRPQTPIKSRTRPGFFRKFLQVPAYVVDNPSKRVDNISIEQIWSKGGGIETNLIDIGPGYSWEVGRRKKNFEIKVRRKTESLDYPIDCIFRRIKFEHFSGYPRLFFTPSSRFYRRLDPFEAVRSRSVPKLNSGRSSEFHRCSDPLFTDRSRLGGETAPKPIDRRYSLAGEV